MKCFVLAMLAAGVVLISSCGKDGTGTVYDNGPTDSLKMNQVQIIASHNSYHTRTDTPIFYFLFQADSVGILPSEYAPNQIDYTHLPLQTQFNDYNVRGLELDIYADSAGGRFYNRAGYSLIGQNAKMESHIDALKEPGFKILHIPDFDFNTTHYTFKSALTDVYNWSVAHPNHLPIFINIETKDDTPADVLTAFAVLTRAEKYDATDCDNLDAEIKSVFGNELDKVFTPDDLRGGYATLEAAALAGNWPQLANARGKVVFIIEGAAENIYKAGHSSLAGRACFVYSAPGTAEAAFVILNGSVSDFAQIRQRVAQGYIVRTRADAGGDEARSGDYTNMNAAFDSWAQIVSTDYYKADPRAGDGTWTNYHVSFPGNALARIDSMSAAGKLGIGVIKE